MDTAPVAEGGHMSQDPELNSTITALYDHMLRGDAGKQAEIDSYIYAELVLRDHRTAQRLRACCPGGRVSDLLRAPASYSIHRDSLPDLGNFIRAVVFFSGDRPSETQVTTTPICCCIYEALPNIKRTKQVKHKLKLDAVHDESHNTSAILSVMMGTLLALFPGGAKVPSFQLRCDIVQLLREVQCSPLRDKLAFLDRVPSLTKLCFMEYVPWFIHAYMPVELQIIEKSPTTRVFLRTCPNVCDMFRQEMIQLGTLDLAQLDKLAGQAIERCTRLCKFKMQRHIYTKDSLLHYPVTIDKTSFQQGIGFLAPTGYHRASKRYKGRASAPLDTTKELHIFYPSEADFTSITYASILHQHLQVVPLPQNIAEEQLRTVARLFAHCSTLQRAARAFHVCATCLLQGRTQAPKFRISLASNTLQCNTCKNDFSVLKLDLIGSVVYFAGKAIVMCPGCANTTMNHGDGRALSGRCRSCAIPPPPGPRARKECARCQSTSIAGTLRLLNSEHMRVEDVPLCAKHIPNASAQRYIHDISQLK